MEATRFTQQHIPFFPAECFQKEMFFRQSVKTESTREYSNLSQKAPWNKKLARKTKMHQERI